MAELLRGNYNLQAKLFPGVVTFIKEASNN